MVFDILKHRSEVRAANAALDAEKAHAEYVESIGRDANYVAAYHNFAIRTPDVEVSDATAQYDVLDKRHVARLRKDHGIVSLNWNAGEGMIRAAYVDGDVLEIKDKRASRRTDDKALVVTTTYGETDSTGDAPKSGFALRTRGLATTYVFDSGSEGGDTSVKRQNAILDKAAARVRDLRIVVLENAGQPDRPFLLSFRRI